MKTPEQKAAEYCKKTNGICAECKKVKNCNIEEKIGSCKSKFPYYFAFLAGYESANESDKTKNICEHVYVSNLDPDEEDYDLICKKCGHRTN